MGAAGADFDELFLDGIAQEFGAIPLDSSIHQADLVVLPSLSAHYYMRRVAVYLSSSVGALTIAVASGPTNVPAMTPPPYSARGYPNYRYRMQSYFGPFLVPVATPANVPAMTPQPYRAPGRPSYRHLYPSYFAPVVIPMAPRGLTAAATFVLDAEDGAQVTYSWATDVLRPRDGFERRISLIGCPRESYSFSIFLNDGQLAAMQSALVFKAAQASAFGIGLSHESLLITAVSGGAALTVPATAYSDWVYPGQTVAVYGTDQSIRLGVIQTSSPTLIALDINVSFPGVVGGRIMPVIPSYLDDTQAFGLYPVNVGRYEMKARATYFGNRTSDWAPLGATVNTYTDPLTASTYPVWDQIPEQDATTPRAAIAGTNLIDRGASLLLVNLQTVADFAREILFHMKTDADRQYFKAFIGQTAGRQKAFLLPTWKPDLLPVGDASAGTLKVSGPPTANVADYVNQWWNSVAHRRLQLLKTDGTVAYRAVSDRTDNGDGTQTLLLDSALAGALSRVSFLETCRFDTDDFVVTFQGGFGLTKIPVRVVQQ